MTKLLTRRLFLGKTAAAGAAATTAAAPVAAAEPDRGSDNPSRGKPNMDTDITKALRGAMASCDDVEHLIHAAWMAARSMKGDELAAGEAIEAVVSLAGERLQDVRFALRKAGAA
jgi:hypothetical protein